MTSCLTPTSRNNTLADDALEDVLHDWIVCLTGLQASLVRPAWQPDPPPIPEFTCPCWVAFYVTATHNDWDAVVQHDMGTSYVTRNQSIDLTLTFYGRDAGNYALDFRMGAALSLNNALLLRNGISIGGILDHQVTSDLIKGRWQNRVDVDVELRRAINFSYKVPDMGIDGPVCVVIKPEQPTPEVDFCVDKNSTIHLKGDC